MTGELLQHYASVSRDYTACWLPRISTGPSRRLGMSEKALEAAIRKGHEFMSKGADLCESPIEKELLPWLIFENYDPLLTFPAVLHDVRTDREAPKGDIMIVPQFLFAKFRLDFALIARWKGQTKIIAVECDGWDFHETERDRVRDAYLHSLGIETVRASGREIFKNPGHVSSRAAALITDWAYEL